ncbi:vWA domain-containing protein [Coralliovum pocilloporae]|uniref:vWA domain-containing protein n=1 Tax=Coralliovum pocilloporae TaxID=3066369 RepID=UPI003306D84A
MTEQTAPTNGGRLAENVAYFGRALRAAGLPVGPAHVVDAVNALTMTGIGSRDDLYWVLQSVFVKRRDHRAVFDEVFELFWRSRGLVEKMISILSPVANPSRAEKQKAGAARAAEALLKAQDQQKELPEPDLEVDARFTVSGKEILQSKDFEQMTVAELDDARQAISELALPSDVVRTRRFQPSSNGRRFDMRRTVRHMMRSGGDLVIPHFRSETETHPPIVALCDISGSVGQYTRIFLHFLHMLQLRGRKVHSFVFGTRLTNITRQLQAKDPDEALDACSAAVEDWSGGTRIATALHRFNRDWSRRVLGQKPTVILFTDGLERDTDEDLAVEMDRLHRSCRRLIWLNPLLRFEAFEARAQGIRMMLPHVDEFRPIHSLNSMADLCAALSGETTAVRDPKQWLRPVGIRPSDAKTGGEVHGQA